MTNGVNCSRIDQPGSTSTSLFPTTSSRLHSRTHFKPGQIGALVRADFLPIDLEASILRMRTHRPGSGTFVVSAIDHLRRQLEPTNSGCGAREEGGGWLHRDGRR